VVCSFGTTGSGVKGCFIFIKMIMSSSSKALDLEVTAGWRAEGRRDVTSSLVLTCLWLKAAADAEFYGCSDDLRRGHQIRWSLLTLKSENVPFFFLPFGEYALFASCLVVALLNVDASVKLSRRMYLICWNVTTSTELCCRFNCHLT
jgi:hypothetical protein